MNRKDASAGVSTEHGLARAQELGLTSDEATVFVEVLKALRQIRHGYIQLVVQDSRVIQIDKMEKVRFSSQSSAVGGQPRRAANEG